MNAHGASPLRYAKREMLKSLNALNEYHQFQIVFYNQAPSPMSGSSSGGRMIPATDGDKRRATSFVQSMPGDGGTEHIPAIKLGLSMAPDVLFFLTDAEDPSISMTQLVDIQQKALLTGTTIHAIQFNVGAESGDGGWIRALAEMNRGIYKYFDVSEFKIVAEPEPEKVGE
jgi:hypothetical protein